jgi:hypothetical protein
MRRGPVLVQSEPTETVSNAAYAYAHAARCRIGFTFLNHQKVAGVALKRVSMVAENKPGKLASQTASLEVPAYPCLALPYCTSALALSVKAPRSGPIRSSNSSNWVSNLEVARVLVQAGLKHARISPGLPLGVIAPRIMLSHRAVAERGRIWLVGPRSGRTSSNNPAVGAGLVDEFATVPSRPRVSINSCDNASRGASGAAELASHCLTPPKVQVLNVLAPRRWG